MEFPSITQYLEAVSDMELFSATLKCFRPEKDFAGNDLFVSGNYAVVFNMYDGGRRIALKCFTRGDESRAKRYRKICDKFSQTSSTYISTPEYLDDQIYVYDAAGCGRYYPVVVSEWVDGHTLDHTLQSRLHHKNYDALAALAEKFDSLALWLLESDFAHGDVKPENIIVTPEGNLKLIDYDGVFMPEMAGEPSSEAGSKPFQHPARTGDYFNKHIDDYSLAVISVSLHALAEDPALYAKHNDGENIILDPEKIYGPAKDNLLESLKDKWVAAGKLKLYRLCELLSSPTPALEGLADLFRAICTGKPERYVYDFKDMVCEGLRVVCLNGRYGYADTDDFLVIDNIYDMAADFSDGRALVSKNGKKFYIDKRGGVTDSSHYNKTGLNVV